MFYRQSRSKSVVPHVLALRYVLKHWDRTSAHYDVEETRDDG